VYLLGFQGSSLRGWCFRDSAVSIFRAVTDSRLTPHIYNTTKLWRILGSDYYVYWTMKAYLEFRKQTLLNTIFDNAWGTFFLHSI
jgi:hypothetical protein